ncbi:hypothetical protein BKA69DRAFT_1061145 [Paraphysoderma sedebokerense]|nr:hypothetical protein BKA69DRAFT_1061145 [Paraphysoderma sedebokerense]
MCTEPSREERRKTRTGHLRTEGTSQWVNCNSLFPSLPPLPLIYISSIPIRIHISHPHCIHTSHPQQCSTPSVSSCSSPSPSAPTSPSTTTTLPTTTQYQTQCASAGQIALTFDGGPHNANTPAVLDVLQAANVKATFHISTQWISQQLTGAIVRRIQSEGHVVGLRYIPNGNLTTMTIAQVRQDLIDQSMAIYRVINSFPRYIRMPFGQTTAEIDSLITDMGFTATNWNIDSEDYRLCQNTGNYTVAQMVEKYTSEFVRFQNAGNLKGAFIALQSDLCAIRDGVDGVLKSIRDYAYTAVTLDTCFGHGTAYKYGTF